jgi:NAD(P)-dependent dehydrogenase (short-subunit alcohol dehydrogenase family)
MKYRTVLVTGASSGIGKATASHIASMGGTVVMLCRDQRRGELAREEIRRQIIDEGKDTARFGSLELAICDLGSLDSIDEFAGAFLDRYPELHVLVNNAGVYSRRRRETADGLELHFGVNYVGHFYLTYLLLPRLRETGASRVINVTSAAHEHGRIHFRDLQLRRLYTPRKAYAQSKLANILFTRELKRRVSDTSITTNSVDPGRVATRLGIDRSTGFGMLRARLRRLALPTPFQGAMAVIRQAVDPDLAQTNGEHFIGFHRTDPSRRAQSTDTARRLWEATEELLALG